MAISITSLNGMSAISKIGISQELYDWLASAPLKVALSANEFVFTLPENMDGPMAGTHITVPVDLSSMQKLSIGQLPLTKKQALSATLTATLQKIRSEHGDALAKLDPTEIIAANKAPAKPTALSKLPPLAPTLSADTKEKLEAIAPVKKTGMWLPFDQAKMKTAPLTKLRDATQMYQPVLGTSAGSRYYLVAANKDLRVAARYMPHKLSVRIEGPGFSKYVPEIKKAGIEVHGAKGYASIHLDVGSDPTMANKTLGAILLGLGIPLETPIPELKKIAI